MQSECTRNDPQRPRGPQKAEEIMNPEIAVQSGNADKPNLLRAFLKRIAQIVASVALLIGVGVVAAGTWHFPRLWIFAGAGVLFVVANAVILIRVNPQVIVGRSRIGSGTKLFEKIILPLYGIAGLAVPAVAGIDTVRLGNPRMPDITLPLGLALYFAGGMPVVWAMMVNPYLEQTVRIQRERGHRVIMEGPYHLVRHPMYVGSILQQIGSVLILGSIWAVVPAALSLVLLVVRTAFEDRTLRAELDGYEAYTTKTRYRLVPGLW